MSLPVLLQTAPPASPFGGSFWMMMIIVFVGYFFLILRPMSRQRKRQDEMQRSLKSGDRVLTTSGIYGTVAKVKEDRVFVRIADGVQVELARNAIASVPPRTEGE